MIYFSTSVTFFCSRTIKEDMPSGRSLFSLFTEIISSSLHILSRICHTFSSAFSFFSSQLLFLPLHSHSFSCVHLGPAPLAPLGAPPCRRASGCCSSLPLVSAPCPTCLSGPGRLQARLSGSNAIVCSAALHLIPSNGLA